ncbi:MAG: GFA family protein [Pseudomonadales bacterium]|uniref:GFA family protein n=1 Tax=Marinobacter xestospongiae TaxID=994319 RepID=UPI0020034958|nr:GFA family protein [Marinobacter xestospongiae]MCG8518179.1 GFA family protein [Pseudomonadales bacterium]MCK7567255.1 GFA family protein [Marinobacter xestospongiae]
MSETFKASANCLCGAVTLQVAAASREADACHCGMCRKWGGGPLLAVDCGTDVTIDGSDHVGVFDSSDWAQRGFCRDCGTHLFYRLKGANQYVLPAGLFADQQDQFHLGQQIFIDHKPAFYDFANQTENLTEAEVFAKYAPPQG